ncbi:DNA-directed RNA polymerase subunit delta [Boudabousia marimammalium]|uniref:DNA-directed RNA polymerase subunit delta n=2 Tax=Boudabousia marimammalium TaxID=156892 RepID=A0A1Q5PQV2_9ACTO|nr:DNA-directed RNA polymerase subunit delta [Boudabousia marimammalium]
MYGVAVGQCDKLRICDLTHNIPPYDIWEASYRLAQTLAYWPAGTVFVSVVDPGVGSERLSVVAKTKQGHYIVTPDNGTLTHVKLIYGIEAVRQIDETKNRLGGSEASYTFHGRDVYAYTGARLAAGLIDFTEVGPEIDVAKVIALPVDPPDIEGDLVSGTIDALDVRYGSLWTSVPRQLFHQLGIKFGDRVQLRIYHDGRIVHSNQLKYVPSFAAVELGESLLYINSLDRVAVAINRGSYARAFNIGPGADWKVTLELVK